MVQKILTTLDGFLPNTEAKLYLYGSRVHDDLKGGEIDFTIADVIKAKTDPFLIQVLTTAIVLHEWCNNVKQTQ